MNFLLDGIADFWNSIKQTFVLIIQFFKMISNAMTLLSIVIVQLPIQYQAILIAFVYIAVIKLFINRGD